MNNIEHCELLCKTNDMFSLVLSTVLKRKKILILTVKLFSFDAHFIDNYTHREITLREKEYAIHPKYNIVALKPCHSYWV